MSRPQRAYWAQRRAISARHGRVTSGIPGETWPARAGCPGSRLVDACPWGASVEDERDA
jgi:hypothetical protein